METKYFGKVEDRLPIPDLTEIQTASYARFLQAGADAAKRKDEGLEGILIETFPIYNYDQSLSLEYVSYELDKPRYTPDECRYLKKTFGHPFRIKVRLNRDQPIEEEVYLGEIPIMIAGGEFIINGAERVIVTQLHRSPGVDFVEETETGDRKVYSCRIIPERGSWIEINVSKKEALAVKIDQSGSLSATCLLRAMSEKYSTDVDILRLFYETEVIPIKTSRSYQKLIGTRIVGDLVDDRTGEVLLESGQIITKNVVNVIRGANLGSKGQEAVPGTPDGFDYVKGVAERLIERAKNRKTRAGWFGYEDRSKIKSKKPGVYVWRYLAAHEKEGEVAYVGLAGSNLHDRLVKLHWGDGPRGNIYGSGPRLHVAEMLEDEGQLKGIDHSVEDLKGYWKLEDKKNAPKALKDDAEKLEKVVTAWMKENLECTFEEVELKAKEAKSLLEHLRQQGLEPNPDKGDAAIRLLGLIEDRVMAEFPDDDNPGIASKGQRARVPFFNRQYPKQTKEEIERVWSNISGDSTSTSATAKTSPRLESIEVIREVADPLILNTLEQDTTSNHDEALLKIYQRLRPGNPAKMEKAKELFRDKFFDPNRYRLGKVGRFRLNRKFKQNVPETEMTLSETDYINALKYMLTLRAGEGRIDDIDHLGNRRLRTIDELASDEIRKGFLKLRRTVQERMSLKDADNLTPRNLVNSKTVSSAIEYFFGRSELSQVVDQTNPLAMLTHERRLSALGPGGLNRKRAGFEVRDVHISHYGRICPIETPEGTNIGLISSLSIFSGVDKYGFMVAPYRVVKKGKVTKEIVWLRADQEEDRIIGPGDLAVDARGGIEGDEVLGRLNGEFMVVRPTEIELMDVSPKQMVGVSAALIPFLEHDDANRALMGSNMQRQAVPLLTSEAPLVGTGMEKIVAENSGMVVCAREAGEVKYVSADKIVCGTEEYELRKFVGLNERTCLNQRPIVKMGDKVKKGQVIADGAGTKDGELALGKNVLVAFMAFDGYNFEDAIIISSELVSDDIYTSIHIEEFEIEIRETKLGKEEFTRDIPNVSEKALRNLDETGVVRIGTHVAPGDILVGKVSPKSKSELSPEEKLLRAIFGRAGEDVKNDSMDVPSGCDGVVVDTRKFSRKAYLTDKQKRENENEVKKVRIRHNRRIASLFEEMIAELNEALGGKMVDNKTGKPWKLPEEATVGELLTLAEEFDIDRIRVRKNKAQAVQDVYRPLNNKIEKLRDERDRLINNLKRGDELEPGVIEMVKVYVATKRVLSVGDKMAGRHGNKGVIARVMPMEDMPFMEDGTPVQILLNPLGVPSRMNVGQILETHLGMAAKTLGYRAICPVFDSASEEKILEEVGRAGQNTYGSTRLYDGRTGEPFDQRVTVGQIYMMKLNHLVDDKIHARATGPYSLITQQPLGGKARSGGQRFGEMEVWALEAYGAAFILQELLTVKSDDVEGRTKIYESMVKGTNTLQAGTPVSFDVFMNEVKGLGLNIMLEKRSL